MVFLTNPLHKKNLTQESNVLDAVFPNQPEGRIVLKEAKGKLANTLSLLGKKSLVHLALIDAAVLHILLQGM